MNTIILALCLTTMVASAPLNVRPLSFSVDGAEARYVEDTVQPANPAWGYFTAHTMDGKLGYTKMYKGNGLGSPIPLGQLPFTPAAFQPYPTQIVPDLRYFPSGNFPAYYPSYPQVNYDFEGQYETKSDDLTPEEYEEALRQFGVNTTANPMSGFINKIIFMNNVGIVKLMLANAAMLIAG